MKSKVIFRSLALTALAFFMLSLAALAEPTPDPTPVPTPAPVYATGASISVVARALAPGEEFNLSVIKVFPEKALDETLEWRSSNPTVASVSEADGSKTTTVRAIKNGRATISLVGKGSLLVLAKCQVTVRTVKITSMTVSPKSLAIAPGQNYILRASIKPSNATFGSVTWTSPDPTIVSFDQAGTLATATTTSDHSVRVYAQAPTTGKFILTAVTDTGRRAACVVTVKALAVSSVKFPKSKLTVYLRDANLKPLTAAISPANTGFTIAYDSLNKDVAEIDPATGVLTLKTPGTATISASAGGKTGYCKLTVALVNIKTLSIKTPSDAAVVLDQGGTALLTAVASPAYAAVTGVTWESDNEAVATVADGLVTAGTTGGYARITARSVFNTKVKATVSVHVRGAGAYRTVTITAAGDAVLGGDPRPKGSAAANPRSFNDFKAAILLPGDDSVAGDGTVFTRVKKYFEGENNIGTLNLEGTLTLKDTRHDKKPFVFQGDPMWAKTMLKDNNIDAVCIANNHSYDVGEEGYKGTMRALDKPYARVKYYGNGITSYIKTENGLKVGFVGFISANSSPSGVMNQVRNAAKNSDMVVAAFHWTDVKEFRYQAPTNRQKSLAHAAIGAGADLVLGHHVHRLNGIERYKGKYIVYDLGNFVTIAKNPLNAFLPDNPRGRFDYDSMIYQQKFNVWADGFVEPADITIIPCSITSSPKALVNNAQPMPYTDPEDIDRVKSLIESRTKDFSDMPITFTH